MNTIIYIGAGCFWGTEAYYQKIKGVMQTEVGYANGPTKVTSYEQVCNQIGHAEVAKVSFDVSILSVQELFDSYIAIIDPFSKNCQGNDIGIQYRTCLYSEDEWLLKKTQSILTKWERNYKKTVIEVAPLTTYMTAEKVHQNYLNKSPNGYCHINLANIPQILKK